MIFEREEKTEKRVGGKERMKALSNEEAFISEQPECHTISV